MERPLKKKTKKQKTGEVLSDSSGYESLFLTEPEVSVTFTLPMGTTGE